MIIDFVWEIECIISVSHIMDVVFAEHDGTWATKWYQTAFYLHYFFGTRTFRITRLGSPTMLTEYLRYPEIEGIPPEWVRRLRESIAKG